MTLEQNTDIAFELLRLFDVAVLIRRSPNEYAFYGHAPEFYRLLFPYPASAGGREQFHPAPWFVSLMLESFLEDAEAFFENPAYRPAGDLGAGDDDGTECGQPCADDACKGSACIKSGIWLECDSTGREWPLNATARMIAGESVILVQCVAEEYAERARILRQARNELLEHRRMSGELNIFREKSLYDNLTKVYNRATFLEQAEKRILTERRGHSRIGFLLLDIDNFKHVNDEYGHLKGDAVLSGVGAILKDSIRKDDIAGRYGGEEFAILVSSADLDQTRLMGEKLRTRMEEHDFGLGHPVTISVGCTVYYEGETVQSMIHRADMAMYEAKKQGKNNVCTRHPSQVIAGEVSSRKVTAR